MNKAQWQIAEMARLIDENERLQRHATNMIGAMNAANEALRAENERLRAALEQISKMRREDLYLADGLPQDNAAAYFAATTLAD